MTEPAQLPLAVVLLSGGMDSTVCMAIAGKEYRLAALHVNYGQRTQERELQSFHDIADYYKAEHRLVVDISHLAAIGGSCLTDRAIDVPQPDLNANDIPISYVPFRNANILAIATSWAEVLGASALFIGAVQDDSSGYPDCREEFFTAFQQVINTGTKPETQCHIRTPLLHCSKQQIVEKGIELGVPFEKTWSCYQGHTTACGECDSCALRLRGFARAGAKDPLPYTHRPDY